MDFTVFAAIAKSHTTAKSRKQNEEKQKEEK